MSVCRDCIHFDACALFWYSDYDCVPSIEDSKQKRALEEACECFVPAADVVEVVRCRDCKHNVANWEHDELDISDYTDITCDYFMTDGMEPNDFCSRGERREG